MESWQLDRSLFEIPSHDSGPTRDQGGGRTGFRINVDKVSDVFNFSGRVALVTVTTETEAEQLGVPVVGWVDR